MILTEACFFCHASVPLGQRYHHGCPEETQVAVRPDPPQLRPLRSLAGGFSTTREAANRRDCSYKQSFRTRGDARQACGPRIRGRRYGSGPPASPYRCPLGSHWHIGHTNQPGT